MPYFKVQLPNDFTLFVEVMNNPADFKLVFPTGKQVDFRFDPKQSRKSHITVSKKASAMKAVPAEPHVMDSVPDDSSSSSGVTYAAELSDGSRPMYLLDADA